MIVVGMDASKRKQGVKIVAVQVLWFLVFWCCYMPEAGIMIFCQLDSSLSFTS